MLEEIWLPKYKHFMKIHIKTSRPGTIMGVRVNNIDCLIAEIAPLE